MAYALNSERRGGWSGVSSALRWATRWANGQGCAGAMAGARSCAESCGDGGLDDGSVCLREKYKRVEEMGHAMTEVPQHALSAGMKMILLRCVTSCEP